MKKLTNRAIENIIAGKNLGFTNGSIARRYGVSKRHVQKLYGRFLKGGRAPLPGRPGRKAAATGREEERMVTEAYRKYRVCACYLERVTGVPHNRIHPVLRRRGMAKREPGRQKRRKWVRYERVHSLTMVHLDWHEYRGRRVLLIEDDASRLIVAGGESGEESEGHATRLMRDAVRFARSWNSCIRQALTDNGSGFTVPKRRHEEYDVDLMSHGFGRMLAGAGIRHICTGLGHPQTNGKPGKLYDLYDRKRRLFGSLRGFIRWHNCLKPHRSLGFDTPMGAFKRKLRTGEMLGLACRMFKW